jgi:hypothetical protein
VSLQPDLDVRRHPQILPWPDMTPHPRSCLAFLLLAGAACAAQRSRAREVTFANATSATLTAADSGASVICVASAKARAPLSGVHLVTRVTGAEAMTGTDGCATLAQRATQVSVSIGRIGYARRLVPVTVRRGYADTVRVLLHPAVVPSDRECRRARRDGQGCL